MKLGEWIVFDHAAGLGQHNVAVMEFVGEFVAFADAERDPDGLWNGCLRLGRDPAGDHQVRMFLTALDVKLRHGEAGVVLDEAEAGIGLLAHQPLDQILDVIL